MPYSAHSEAPLPHHKTRRYSECVLLDTELRPCLWLITASGPTLMASVGSPYDHLTVRSYLRMISNADVAKSDLSEMNFLEVMSAQHWNWRAIVCAYNCNWRRKIVKLHLFLIVTTTLVLHISASKLDIKYSYAIGFCSRHLDDMLVQHDCPNYSNQ